MRAAAILGLGSSPKALTTFQQATPADWLIGLPASPQDANVILIFGGDGTLHRHLAQLVRLQLPVLVVPCGSGNDFARALKLPQVKSSLAAWRDFVAGHNNIHKIDLGVIRPMSAGEAPAPHTSHYFAGIAGLGLDTEVARRANRLPRWIRGHGGYALSLPPALLHLTHKPVQIDITPHGQPDAFIRHSDRPLLLAAFANTPNYGGGMKIAPHARFDDGKLDVCLISPISALKLARLFPTVYFGRHLGIPEVEYFQTTRLRVQTEHPTDVYADGEYVCQTPAEIGVQPAALKVITGA